MPSIGARLQVGLQQLVQVDVGLEPGGEQVEAANLAMQKQCVCRWCVPVVLLHAEPGAGVSQAAGQITVAKVVVRIVAHRLTK